MHVDARLPQGRKSMNNKAKAMRRRGRRARRAANHGLVAFGAGPHMPAQPGVVGATGEEIAQFLRVHVKTVERWRKQLGLPCLRIGGRVRYVLGDVTRWASARKEGS
jgi:excisionase family DNA binding protein